MENYTRAKRTVEQVKFDAGVSVAGKLVKLDRVQVNESAKKAVQYTVLDLETRTLKTFLGTHQINSVVLPGDVGKLVEIICTGEDKTIVRNGRAMKTFDVYVWERNGESAVEREDGTVITDADIPF